MRRILFIINLLLPLLIVAQSKIAVYNSQDVFNALPDKAAAEAKLKATSDKLQAEYKMLQADFDKKYAEYQAIATDPATPAAIRDRRMQEVGDQNGYDLILDVAKTPVSYRSANVTDITPQVKQKLGL